MLVTRPHPVLVLIEVAHEVGDTGGVSFANVEGFGEAAPNAGEASIALAMAGAGAGSLMGL